MVQLMKVIVLDKKENGIALKTELNIFIKERLLKINCSFLF